MSSPACKQSKRSGRVRKRRRAPVLVEIVKLVGDPNRASASRSRRGHLIGRPLVGRGMIVVLNERHQWVTTPVMRVFEEPGGVLWVETRNSRYRLTPLMTSAAALESTGS